MNNDSIKQGAYYLLRGGTLLSEPCKKCGNLQIKFKGEILCLDCQADKKNENSSSINADNERSQSIGNDDEGKEQQDLSSVDESTTKIKINLVLDQIEHSLIKHVSELGAKITLGDYSKEHSKALKGIKECLIILEMVRRLKGIQD
jgi:UPF0148 protein